MNLIPWRNKRSDIDMPAGGTAMMPFRGDFDRLLDRFMGGGPLGFGAGGLAGLLDPTMMGAELGRLVPPVDIVESENEITVRVELPGVDADGVNVQVAGNSLVIEGEKEESDEDRGRNYYRAERRFGSFQRRIPLPETVNADEVTAEFRNGLLEIHLPKTEQSRARQIPVNTGQEADLRRR